MKSMEVLTRVQPKRTNQMFQTRKKALLQLLRGRRNSDQKFSHQNCLSRSHLICLEPNLITHFGTTSLDSAERKSMYSEETRSYLHMRYSFLA